MTAGLPARLALVFDIVGNTVKSSVNGSVEATATLTGNDNNNWRGDHSVNFINAGSGTGASNSGTGAFGVTAPATIKVLANGNSAVSSVRFWNESSGTITATSGTSDSVTATLTITGWASSADGTLTAGSGNGESFSAGVWTVTGNAEGVNTALAAVEFVTGDNTADPTIIGVSIDDGDEDGGGPRTGAILYSETAPNPIYVDDSFTGSIGDSVADCDLGTAGAQSGTIGLNAFTTLTGALGAVQPAGSVVINDGDYTTENATLADTVTLQLTDTAGPVQIGDLGAATTTSIDLQGNTLEVGATGNVGPGIDAIISGSGNFTKVGSALLVFRGVNTYTGTTTILDGTLRVGFVNITGLQGELAGDGPVVVTDAGRLELNVDVDKTISQTGVISGTGSVGTLGDGTIIFDNPGANTFTG
ncbi:autotransporter-associated beta strand repeat-containing protein, partial [bacterium]|nr:autotransporter-associated beta strand repeat-containing protein [bacterium]